MTDPMPRGSFLYGMDGHPVVVVPARVADWLDRHAGLNSLRIAGREVNDAEVTAVLTDIHIASLKWRASVAGIDPRKPPEAMGASPVMNARQAADELGLTDRAVRLAITQKRLHATKDHNNRWAINREDLEHFRAARAAA